MGTFWKKRIASNSTDKTIPMVVKIAIVDPAMSNTRITASTRSQFQ